MPYVSLFHRRAALTQGTLTRIDNNVVALPGQLPGLLDVQFARHPTRLDAADPVLAALKATVDASASAQADAAVVLGRIDLTTQTLKTDIVTGLEPSLKATGDDIVQRLKLPPATTPAALDEPRRAALRALVQAQAQALDATPDEPYTGNEAGYKGKGLTKNNVQMDKLRKGLDMAAMRTALGAERAGALESALRDFAPAATAPPSSRELRFREMHQVIAAIAG